VTFTATPDNGGSTPSYQWLKNGTNINGANSSTYSTATLVNGDVISVVLTSSSSCASTTTATSNTITVNITTNGVTLVSITSTIGTSVCTGQSVTFIATPVNGGSAPSYQWQDNGVPVSGATASTNTFSSLS